MKNLNIQLYLKVLLFIVVSWLLVHMLSVFGFVLVVAYPIWWAISPKRIPCFLCRSRREGDKCPFCRTVIDKTKVYPKRLGSAFLNGLLILSFTILSLGAIFIEGKFLEVLGFPRTSKTVLFTIPTKGQYKLGEIFPVSLEIVGVETPINTVQVDLGFDKNMVELVDLSTEGSFANIFVQKEINNEVGYARLTGGVPNPGYFEEKGFFGTAYFKTKTPGVVEIEFLPSSMVLANDGRGTNVLKEYSRVSYLILPEKVAKSETKIESLSTGSKTILGEKTEETQMIFYDEKPVLGLQTEKEITLPSSPKEELLDILLNALHYYDTQALNGWKRIIDFLNFKMLIV